MYVVAKPTSEKEAQHAGKEGQGGGGLSRPPSLEPWGHFVLTPDHRNCKGLFYDVT